MESGEGGGGERQPHKPGRRMVGWMEAALERTAKKKIKLKKKEEVVEEEEETGSLV